MAEAVGSLRVDVAANVAQIRQDMGAVKNSIAQGVAGINASLGKMNAQAMASSVAMGAMKGTAMALGTFLAASLSRQMVAAAAEIGDLAARLGMTTDAMQVWSYAAKTVGASTQDIVKIFEKLNEKLGEVSTDITPTQLAFQKLGLTIGQLKNLNPDEQLKMIADRLANIANPAQRAAVASELLGDKANDMLALFAKGRGGIDAITKEMRDFGLILSSDTIQKAQAANREFQVIETLVGNAGKAIAAEMLPALKQFREIITDPTFQTMMGGFSKMIGLVAEGVSWAFKGIRYALQAPDILMAAGRVGDLTQELAKAKAQLDALVAAGEPADEAAAKYETIAAKLADAQRKLAEVTTLTDRVIQKSDPIKSASGVLDTKKAAEVQKAARDLAFEFQKLSGDYSKLAEGFPQLAYGLGIFDEKARRAYATTGQLTGSLKMLESAQLAVNAAKLKEEMLNPLETYNRELDKLNQLMASGIVTTETYNRKLLNIKEAYIQAGGAAVSFKAVGDAMGTAVGNALENMIVNGKSWKESMISFAQEVYREMMRIALIKPIVSSISGSVTGFLGGVNTGTVTTSAKGNAFFGGRLTAFAKGGIVGGPTVFPMKSGTGLMGEAGPEAVMPLERGPDGRLGVRNNGGGAAVYNIDARGSDAGVTDRIMMALAAAEKGRPDSVSQLMAYRKRFPTRG